MKKLFLIMILALLVVSCERVEDSNQKNTEKNATKKDSTSVMSQGFNDVEPGDIRPPRR